MAILVAIAVNENGYREVLGVAEGMKEDKAGWISFFQCLRSRGLDGVKLIVDDKCLGMLEAVRKVFPEVKYQLGRYISPVIDCYDGILVAWNISCKPDAQLLNTMLDRATHSLPQDAHPILHSMAWLD